MKWPLGAGWGIRLGAAKFSPKVSPLHPLAIGEFSGKAEAGTDNLWLAAVTTVQLEGLFQPCMQGRGTAASPKRVVSALIAATHREGEGAEAGIAEVSTLLCLEEQRWIDAGRVSDTRECWLERSVSRADIEGLLSMDIYAGARSPCLGELTLCADVILTVMDSQPLLVRVSCMDVWAAPAALKALWSVCVQGLMYQFKLLDHRWSHVSQKKKKKHHPISVDSIPEWLCKTLL